MSVLRTLGNALGTSVRAARGVTTGGFRAGRFVGRNVGVARRKGAAGESGMLRLLDLHAASCAGDTLVAIGLANTIFFAASVGEARGSVALYLLVTMLPFALLAPVIGPALDRFRHGRRYALATTFLGRAFLAYLLFEHIADVALYPAAFGMLVLSRAYGVARSAAVPRLLPAGLGLSEAGARASVFGTFAGAAVLPFGLIAAGLWDEGPLLLAVVPFLFGMVTALRLPPRADSDPPEHVPRPLRRQAHKGAKVLSGRLVVAALAGSASLRALYGFLALFLAFAIRSGDLPVTVLGVELGEATAIAFGAVALAVGSFLATAVGTKLRIRRPALVQGVGIAVVAVIAIGTATRLSLGGVILLCLATAIASGLAKLTVDAVIQERIDERVRASAFAHSETLLMIAWVLGGAVGLIPFGGRTGMIVVAGFAVLATVRAMFAMATLRGELLNGRPMAEGGATQTVPGAGPVAADVSGRGGAARPGGPVGSPGAPGGPAGGSGGGSAAEAPTQRMPSRTPPGNPGGGSGSGTRRLFGWRRSKSTDPTTAVIPAVGGPTDRRSPTGQPGAEQSTTTAGNRPDDDLSPPGFALYRPTRPDPTRRLPADDDGDAG